ncbi:MAG: uracil-DNA glycosylase [Verrucomicrobiaceae bacterium]|nr:uracil-DNA glycosylase [Verrucomicrobiaceae bacterium]
MSAANTLEDHVRDLAMCERCPKMHRPSIVTGPVQSKVLLVGQAPGAREPVLGRPFAWTAGKTLFRWMQEATGIGEDIFRQRVYIASVCRCFPGRNPKGGDRVPNEIERANCRPWLEAEMRLLQPHLVIPIGKLAISQFMPVGKLVDVIGVNYSNMEWQGFRFDLLPLPHPSGASTWHRMEPGKLLTVQALELLAAHPAICAL